MPLATIFVNIILKDKNWRSFRPYAVILWKEFEISLKEPCFENFEPVNCPGQFSGSWSMQRGTKVVFRISYKMKSHESTYLN